MAVVKITANDVINSKVIICGNVVEIYDYSQPIIKRLKPSVGRSGSKFTTAEVKAINRKKTAQRAKTNVRRLVNANFDMRKFLTLTFADDIRDLTIAHKHFDRFLKRLKRYIDKPLKYICVPEFQDKTRNGVVHYHVLLNLDYIPNEKLADLWGNGFVRINCIDKVDNVGSYVTKYMSKTAIDDRLIGRRCYFASKNLNKPIEITTQEVVEDIIVDIAVDNCCEIIRYISYTYTTDCYGDINYRQFVLDKPLDTEKYLKSSFGWKKFLRKVLRIPKLPFKLPAKQLSFC